MGLGLLFFFRVEQGVAIFAGLLGLIHGLGGVAQQRVGIAVVLRKEGDAEAGRELERILAEGDGRGGDIEQALEDVFAFAGTVDVGDHRAEFVAAKTRQGIAFTQGVAQAVGEGDEQLVAGFVSVQVVDILEAVDVKIDQHQRALIALRLDDRQIEPVGEQRAVRHAGQAVVMRHAFDLPLVCLELGDVREDRDVMPRHAVFDGGDGEAFGVEFAALGAVPEFAFPMTVDA